MSYVQRRRDAAHQAKLLKMLSLLDGSWKVMVSEFAFLQEIADHLVRKGLFLSGVTPRIIDIRVSVVSEELLATGTCGMQYDMAPVWPRVSSCFLVVNSKVKMEYAQHPHIDFDSGNSPTVGEWLASCLLASAADHLRGPVPGKGRRPTKELIRLEDISHLVVVHRDIEPTSDFDLQGYNQLDEREFGFRNLLRKSLSCHLTVYKVKPEVREKFRTTVLKQAAQVVLAAGGGYKPRASSLLPDIAPTLRELDSFSLL